MPVTPFHFGPGLLFKAIAPRHVSFSAFVASQIVIDVESGYHLLRGDWPVHRVLHTLPVATLAGLSSAGLVWGAARLLRLKQRWSDERTLPSEVDARPAAIGGLLGGITHPIFDGIMHSDVQPFWPLSLENPLLDLIGLGALHLGCVIAGALGAIALGLRRPSEFPRRSE
jgi:hypothetical protein